MLTRSEYFHVAFVAPRNGFDVVANNGDQFRKFLDDEIARWKTVIETGKITAE